MSKQYTFTISPYGTKIVRFGKKLNPISKMKIMIEMLDDEPDYEDVFYFGLYLCDEICELSSAQLSHITGFSVNPITNSLVLTGDKSPYEFPCVHRSSERLQKAGVPLW